MSVSYMIRGRTEAECAAALERLCRLLGAVPTILPTDRLGSSGWLARASSLLHEQAGSSTGDLGLAAGLARHASP
ncbi:hypothetical protein ACWCXX_06305 [Streptomyces sp. NPDC001732]